MLNNQEISMPVLIEDLGMQFSSSVSKFKKRFGIYKCSCGKEFKTQCASIASGNTNSCGCYHRKKSSVANKTHGTSNHRIYRIWSGIISRTTNESNQDYKEYGGRGISMCNEWRNDFMSFYNWAMENGYEDGLTIDRIDVNGNYEPSNCRWANATIQARNTQILKKNNTSGYRGVTRRKDRMIFESRISVNYKRVHMGSFKTALEAAKAYDNYVIENNLEHTINGV